MDGGNRKILLASAALAMPLALLVVSFSTGAQPRGGFTFPGMGKQPAAAKTAPAAATNSTTNGGVSDSKPGGLIQAIGKLQSKRATNTPNVQQTGGLLQELLGKRAQDQEKKLAAQADAENRPAPNWDGIPFHEPTRFSQNNGPIRDPKPIAAAQGMQIPQPPADNSPVAAPAQVVRRSVARPIQAKPAAARINQSRSVLVDTPEPAPVSATARRVVTQKATTVPADQPLSQTESNRRTGRSVVVAESIPSASDLPGVPVTRSRAISANDVELAPKVSRRIIQTAPAKVAAAPKPTAAKKVAPKADAAAKPIAKVPSANVAAKSTLQKPVVANSDVALAPLPPLPPADVAAKPEVLPAPSAPVSHRSGPPETAFEPRRGLTQLPQPTKISEPTMSVVSSPIGSGVADPSDNEGTLNVRPRTKLVVPGTPTPMLSHPKMTPEPSARIAQRPGYGPSVPAANPQHTYQRDPYATREMAPISPLRNDRHVAPTPTYGTQTQPAPSVANEMRVQPRGPVQSENSHVVTSELPGIRVVTHGPRSIMIRQTHQFEIRVENRGSVDAEGVLVRATIPEWAEMRGQNATRGGIVPETGDGTERLVWTIDQLPAGSVEKMYVRVKAKRSGTHGLDVDWTLKPQKSVTQIQVHEPRLQLTIDGPSEVVFGESQSYKVRVLNPGDGIAPNVVFTLSPNSSTPQTQRIGDIPPGKEAQFEVELTAQDLGDLKIDGLASGDLELRAEAAKTIRVSAAQLDAVISGPEVKYQNTEATYALQIQNKGTATSQNVLATLTLPAGVNYIGGLSGAIQRGAVVQWTIDSMTPGTTRDYQFRCNMASTGNQTFGFECKGSAAGQADVAITTQVESISDLVMTINDPAAPAPVGAEVAYEIVIRNRGSRAATDVRAIAQFSHGIEPLRLQGQSGEVLTGQVLFDPISKIGPNEEVHLKVVAKAERAGHHRFRSEIRSGDTVLVAEEATHYMSPRSERVSRRSSDKPLR